MQDSLWSDGDIHLLYQNAHHDIWWAKSQLWSASNWAIALQAVVVGANELVNKDNEMTLCNTWPFLLLAILIAISISGYLSRLQYDIICARLNIEFLKAQSNSLNELIKKLPRKDYSTPVIFRGMLFIFLLFLAISLALGIATYIFSKILWLAILTAFIEFIFCIFFIYYAIKKPLSNSPPFLNYVK